MPSGVYKRKPEHGAAISAAKTGIPNTPEHNAAISKGLRNSDAVKAYADTQRCIPRTPEACAAISKGRKNSDAVKAHADEMRGGDDICDHHYIYDHSDLSLNTVQMTRSDHTSLHNLLRKLDYIVPHINIKEI